MAYQGYLIKVGNYEISMKKFIKAESYTVYRSITDYDSTRDANGYLVRNALDHQPNKVEFETPAMLTNKEFAELMRNISNQYTVPKERKASVTLYIPELDDYVTQDMYMPDIKPTIYGSYGNELHYNSIRLSFIGY